MRTVTDADEKYLEELLIARRQIPKETIEAIGALKASAFALGREILKHTPPGDFQRQALNHLKLSVMLANAGTSFDLANMLKDSDTEPTKP
jgi:predicted regulator of Ras-like GTPase activity (Roadblock/LC7/MglB family)